MLDVAVMEENRKHVVGAPLTPHHVGTFAQRGRGRLHVL